MSESTTFAIRDLKQDRALILGIKELAFALEGLGRQQEAIDILEEIHTRSTELMGILAGRLKRRWLADPEVRHDDGLRARKLYGDAFSIAERKKDHAQAYYNGINYAFMVLALDKDREGARKIAAAVLPHTAAEKTDPWRRPTQGEAYLYLGDVPSALLAYADAAKQTWDSRDLQSMERQAIWAARLIEDPRAEAELQTLFQKQLGE